MKRSFTGRKRLRKSYGRIPEVAQMPNAALRPIRSPLGHVAGSGMDPSGKAAIDTAISAGSLPLTLDRPMGHTMRSIGSLERPLALSAVIASITDLSAGGPP